MKNIKLDEYPILSKVDIKKENTYFNLNVNVSKKRKNLFEMMLYQFNKETSYLEKKITTLPINLNDFKQTEILVENTEYIRFSFIFNDETMKVIKFVTDIIDSVNFLNEIYGYDKDDNEILLIQYPIGQIISGKTIVSYEFDRINKKVNYILR